MRLVIIVVLSGPVSLVKIFPPTSWPCRIFSSSYLEEAPPPTMGRPPRRGATSLRWRERTNQPWQSCYSKALPSGRQGLEAGGFGGWGGDGGGGGLGGGQRGGLGRGGMTAGFQGWNRVGGVGGSGADLFGATLPLGGLGGFGWGRDGMGGPDTVLKAPGNVGTRGGFQTTPLWALTTQTPSRLCV